jgi:hypothetical protein
MNKGEKKGTIGGCLFGMQSIQKEVQLITDNMPLYVFLILLERQVDTHLAQYEKN